VIWLLCVSFGQEPYHFDGLELLQNPSVNEVDKYFDAYGYYYTGGHYKNELIPFRLHIPSAIKQHKRYPLIVFFHGRGNYGGNYKQLACLKNVKYDNEFFLLAASCNKQHDCWGTVETDTDKRSECPAHVTLEIIRYLIKVCPVDETQIHLIGYSDGTNAVSYMVKEGLKPKSAIYIGNEPPKEDFVYFDKSGYKRHETDIYFFYGNKDPTFPIGTIKPFAEKVKQNNGTIEVHELGSPYEGHDSYKYVLGEYQLIQRLVERKGKDND
jgi:predicted peptidase